MSATAPRRMEGKEDVSAAPQKARSSFITSFRCFAGISDVNTFPVHQEQLFKNVRSDIATW